MIVSDDSIGDNNPRYIDGHIGGYGGDRLIFKKVYDKAEAHKMLCNAPFSLKIQPAVDDVQSRVMLHSKLGASSEDLCCCAEYCYNMMCSRRWCRTVLYKVFENEHCVRMARIANNNIEGRRVWTAEDICGLHCILRF